MADDTYHPTSTHPQPSGVLASELFVSAGAPSSTSGYPPNAVYINSSNGNIYKLVSGAWVLQVTGGGSGSTEVFSMTGSNTPASAGIGVPSSGAGVAYNGDGNVWIYTALGWEQRF